jgi:hypothetical protein
MKSKAQRRPTARDTGLPHNHDPAANGGGRAEPHLANPDPAHRMTESYMEAAILAEAPPEVVDDDSAQETVRNAESYRAKTPEGRARQLECLQMANQNRKARAEEKKRLREAGLLDVIGAEERYEKPKKPAKKEPRPPPIKDLLDQTYDDSRSGAKLSKAGKIQWLERVMGHPAVPLTVQMTAFNLHGKLTGDLLDDDKAETKQAQIDPANLMYQLSCYANQTPGRFLPDLGGVQHVLAILVELGRIEPREIAKVALEMQDAEGNITLPRLPLVDLPEPFEPGESEVNTQ